MQYADYTLWQRELLGDEDDPESAIARAAGVLGAALPALPEELELPADRPRPPVPAIAATSWRSHIGAELHARLVRLARESRRSLFMVLQAGLRRC